jgi:zinc transport system permease protein
VVSAEIDTAPGATIVIVALVAFVGLAVAGALWQRRPAPRRPVPAEPPDVVFHG